MEWQEDFKAFVERLTGLPYTSKMEEERNKRRQHKLETQMTKKSETIDLHDELNDLYGKKAFKAVSQYGLSRLSHEEKLILTGHTDLDLMDTEERRERQKAERDKAGMALEAIQKGRSTDVSIDVAPDRVVSPFVNYQRPVASPLMEVKVPFEIESGIVMPPLPQHKCEIPKAIETKVDKWGDSNDKKDEILLEDRSIFSCICGKDWFVRVTRVPFHASQYDPQYAVKWREIHWYNFARKAELGKRRED